MHLGKKQFHFVSEFDLYSSLGIDERNFGAVLNFYEHDFWTSSASATWRKKTGIMLTVFFGIGEWCIEAWYLWRHKEGR